MPDKKNSPPLHTKEVAATVLTDFNGNKSVEMAIGNVTYTASMETNEKGIHMVIGSSNITANVATVSFYSPQDASEKYPLKNIFAEKHEQHAYAYKAGDRLGDKDLSDERIKRTKTAMDDAFKDNKITKEEMINLLALRNEAVDIITSPPPSTTGIMMPPRGRF